MSASGLMTIGELSQRTGTLLAAARGYAGCEVLTVSNWLPHRDDQVGCVLFTPVDALARGRRG